jgi:N-acetylglucosaminylphosphatidylinositol deacetylase
MLQLAFLTLAITSIAAYGFFHGRFLKNPITRTSILLAIAHPDDEVMFFGPTLAELSRPEHGNTIHVLCMSSGKVAEVCYLSALGEGGFFYSELSFDRIEYDLTICALLLVQLIGNHDGLGETRKKELVASCKTFGIREANILVLEREYVHFPSIITTPHGTWRVAQDKKNNRILVC